ncbi:hypothetical protein FEM03_02860 [Phragmitibacter flavus]|uniref:Prenyltransferase n=1 Tax=Phragmitibacter flavus TaxID=2576071 RepID=A0A5R8KJ82_9BACT|nr:hypothetical protein FEM03_02860 [Phragmitibacter flavus]
MMVKMGVVSELSDSMVRPRVPWWMWGNVLSLDAPLVAAGWLWMLAEVSGVKLPWACFAVLWMTVWFIYVLDRTMDGWRSEGEGEQTARHRFYLRHRAFMVREVLPLMGVVTGWLAMTQIPVGLMERGMGLGLVVGWYLWNHAGSSRRWMVGIGNALMAMVVVGCVWWSGVEQWSWVGPLLLVVLVLRLVGGRLGISKEICCGVVFALGCGLSVHFYSMDQVAGFFSVEVMGLAMLAVLNCVGIAALESGKEDASSASMLSGKRFTVLVAGVVGGLAGAWWVGTGGVLLEAAFFGVVSMGLVYHWAPKMPGELPRVLMDVALLVPVGWVWWWR